MVIFKNERREISDVIAQLAKHNKFMKRLEGIGIFSSAANMFDPVGWGRIYGDIEFTCYCKLPEINNYHYKNAVHYDDNPLVDNFIFKVCYNADTDKWFVVLNGYLKTVTNVSIFGKITNVSDSNFVSIKHTLTEKYINFLFEHYPPKLPKVYEVKNVYLMYERATGKSKIGISKDTNQRLKTLSYQAPTLEFVKSWKGTVKDEQALHEIFEDKCITGEWFFLEDGDIDVIENYFNSKTN